MWHVIKDSNIITFSNSHKNTSNKSAARENVLAKKVVIRRSVKLALINLKCQIFIS